jgi:hypothetical protein
MSFPYFTSIRASLVFLVLVAVLPALGIMLFTGYTLRENTIISAENSAMRQIQVMGTHHERVVEQARLLLATLSKAREVQAFDPLGTQLLLEEMLSGNEAFDALALSDAAGRIVAVSPVEAFSSIESGVFFQEVLRHNRFAMGPYHLLEDSRHVVMEFAQPVLDREGKLQGVLVASFDLNYFGRVFAEAHLPEGSIFTLTDAEGMRLTRFPETERYTWVADLPRMVSRMSGPEEEGTFLEKGVDGVRRLYSYKRLSFSGTPLQGLMIRLGQREDTALSAARWAMAWNFVSLALAAFAGGGGGLARWRAPHHAPPEPAHVAAGRLGTATCPRGPDSTTTRANLAAWPRPSTAWRRPGASDRDRRRARRNAAS